MTKKKLNTYTLEFRESAIKLALDSDESIPQITKNLGVNSNSLYTWVHNASKPKGQPRRTSHDFLRKVRRGLF
jgi:transposase